jgi:hypothetical protein
MYAEVFGIQNPSAAVEAAAKWVQWAQTGLLSGAAENDATIRYNLNQFWTAKAAAYPVATLSDQANLDRLDTWVHGIWSALETGKIYASSPTYWQFWKSYLTGGTPINPDTIAAATAAAAANAGQQAAAQRVSAESPAQSNFGAAMAKLAVQNTANIPQDVASARAMWTQPGISPLGIPLLGWAALGIIGIILVASPRR